MSSMSSFGGGSFGNYKFGAIQQIAEEEEKFSPSKLEEEKVDVIGPKKSATADLIA